MIDALEVRNFKSLRSVKMVPSNVNLVIGANGTGKSNLADLLEFVSRCCRFGLKEALNQFLGLEEVRTKMKGSGKPPTLGISVELGRDESRGVVKACYSFSLARTKDLSIQSERLQAQVYRRSPGKPRKPGIPIFDTARVLDIAFARERGTGFTHWTDDTLGPKPPEMSDEETLVLSTYGKAGDLRTVTDYLGSIRSYNIDATLAKRGGNGAQSELSRYGENLVMFLRRMLEKGAVKQQLLEDLREAVPYIETISPEQILSLRTLKFRERDSELEFFSQQVSDGTLRLLGLLTVLRQPVPPTAVVIEEPENALHPYAVNVLLRVAAHVSSTESFPIQIFLTSHSPVLLDGVLGLDFAARGHAQGFVSKRKDGAATIEAVPKQVMEAIAENLGRPSDFHREGSFGDAPEQLELFLDRSSSQ